MYDGTNNTGFSNKEFLLRWEYFRSSCIFCPKERNNIYTGKTDADGRFSFSVMLDTTLFRDYSLKLFTAGQENYYNSFTNYIEDSSLTGGKEIKVEYYPTTKLALRMIRTQNDPFNTLTLGYWW